MNEKVAIASVSKTVYLDNSKRLENQVLNDTEWMVFWEQLFTASVSDELDNFAELEQALKQKNQKIVFIVDGLEEKVPTST